MKNVKNILKTIFLKNLPLKLLAVVLAIVTWILVVNIDNPTERVVISGISVNMINGESLTDKGYVYSIETGSTISIVVKAPKSVAENLRASDFSASADLGERSPDSDRAAINVICTNATVSKQVEIVSLRNSYVQLSIDNKVDKEMPLEIEVTGTPAKGYTVGNFSASPTTIKVSGAKAIVDRIAHAKIIYNIESMTTNVEDSVKPTFFDETGKEIKSDKLELSRNTVKLLVDILPTKTVKVEYVVDENKIPDGYGIKDIEGKVEEVTIAAPKEKLDEISSLVIGGDRLDISDCYESKTFDISLYSATNFPSDGIIVSSKKEAKITVYIEKIVSKSVIAYMNKDMAVNLRDGWDFEFSAGTSPTFEVLVTGLSSEVENITEKDIEASIDFSEATYKEGTYLFRVSVICKHSKCTISNDVATVKITLIDKNKKEPESEPETEPETETETETEPETETEIETETEPETEPETQHDEGTDDGFDDNLRVIEEYSMEN